MRASNKAIRELERRGAKIGKNLQLRFEFLPRRGWSKEELDFLHDNYPQIGKVACAEALKRPLSQIRSMASLLGLKLDRSSTFWKDWQSRAKTSKIGKKNLKLSETNRKLRAEGNLKKEPWTDERRLKLSASQKKRLAIHHPRGALGMNHTAETKRKISISSVRAWRNRTPEEAMQIKLKQAKTRAINNKPFNPHGPWKAGWRFVGGDRIYFRSRWEANYARFLEWQRLRGEIKKWEHEPETFWFEGVKRGTVSYLPDFRVTKADDSREFHEVKGWMDERSKTKIRRMQKYHPHIVLVVVDAASYRKLEVVMKLVIEDWE